MIKQREGEICADQVYLGQLVSSHVLPLPVWNRLCSMCSEWVLAMQPTKVSHEPARCFAQRQNCCLSNGAAAIIHSSEEACFEVRNHFKNIIS